MDSSFKDAIRDHLQLKERNRWIETTMPLSRYRSVGAESEPVVMDGHAGGGDVIDVDGPAGWPTAESLGLEQPESLWARSPEFDWGEQASTARQHAA